MTILEIGLVETFGLPLQLYGVGEESCMHRAAVLT
jgi:hypothetical protein